jgi:hypothetical protein
MATAEEQAGLEALQARRRLRIGRQVGRPMGPPDPGVDLSKISLPATAGRVALQGTAGLAAGAADLLLDPLGLGPGLSGAVQEGINAVIPPPDTPQEEVLERVGTTAVATGVGALPLGPMAPAAIAGRAAGGTALGFTAGKVGQAMAEEDVLPGGPEVNRFAGEMGTLVGGSLPGLAGSAARAAGMTGLRGTPGVAGHLARQVAPTTREGVIRQLTSEVTAEVRRVGPERLEAALNRAALMQERIPGLSPDLLDVMAQEGLTHPASLRSRLIEHSKTDLPGAEYRARRVANQEALGQRWKALADDVMENPEGAAVALDEIRNAYRQVESEIHGDIAAARTAAARRLKGLKTDNAGTASRIFADVLIGQAKKIEEEFLEAVGRLLPPNQMDTLQLANWRFTKGFRAWLNGDPKTGKAPSLTVAEKAELRDVIDRVSRTGRMARGKGAVERIDAREMFALRKWLREQREAVRGLPMGFRRTARERGILEIEGMVDDLLQHGVVSAPPHIGTAYNALWDQYKARLAGFEHRALSDILSGGRTVAQEAIAPEELLSRVFHSPENMRGAETVRAALPPQAADDMHRAMLNYAVSDMEAAIQKAAVGKEVDAISRWMISREQVMREMPEGIRRVLYEIRDGYVDAAVNVTNRLASLKSIEQSVFGVLAKLPPGGEPRAIRVIMGSDNPLALLNEVELRLMGNERALQGLRSGLWEHWLWPRARANKLTPQDESVIAKLWGPTHVEDVKLLHEAAALNRLRPPRGLIDTPLIRVIQSRPEKFSYSEVLQGLGPIGRIVTQNRIFMSTPLARTRIATKVLKRMINEYGKEAVEGYMGELATRPQEMRHLIQGVKLAEEVEMKTPGLLESGRAIRDEAWKAWSERLAARMAALGVNQVSAQSRYRQAEPAAVPPSFSVGRAGVNRPAATP